MLHLLASMMRQNDHLLTFPAESQHTAPLRKENMIDDSLAHLSLKNHHGTAIIRILIDRSSSIMGRHDRSASSASAGCCSVTA